MTEKISKNDIADILSIVVCISAKDGVLSDIELEKAREEFPKFFGIKVSNKKMESVLDDFFHQLNTLRIIWIKYRTMN